MQAGRAAQIICFVKHFKFSGVVAVLFFLTCDLKYTVTKKCPLLYSKVHKVSFIVLFWLLGCTFHKPSYQKDTVNPLSAIEIREFLDFSQFTERRNIYSHG